MRDHTYQILNDLYAERMRQEATEGFGPEHDDGLVMAELGRMAASYILFAASESVPGHLPIRQVLSHRATLVWPVVDGEIKPHPPRRALVIAAALIMAEIERIDRRDGYQSPSDRTEAGSRFKRRAALDAAFPPGRLP
jgi:hypothetical protein